MKAQKQPYMGTVKVGPKGQIVIPKEVREMFQIEPGDSLILMAHPEKGIAIERPTVLRRVAAAIFAGKGKDLYPEEPEDHLENFAENISKTVDAEEKEHECH